MKVLILGASGQVGRELMQARWPLNTRLVGLVRPELDLARGDTIDEAMAVYTPDLVVNAAAYTAVDKAESEREMAFVVNRDGPGRLAVNCAARGVALIHISTDYVFDGAKLDSYTEDDRVNPINVYGASKEAGEALVRALCGRHIILRTSWVYASHGTNFVKTMVRLGLERDRLGVVADQCGTPTAAGDVAAAIARIGADVVTNQKLPWGTYHFAGAGETSWYGLAESIFQHFEGRTGRRPEVKAITTADYPTAARRPSNSRLNCARIRAAFGIEPPRWEESLGRVLREILASYPSPSARGSSSGAS